jgi:hypothetical protein
MRRSTSASCSPARHARSDSRGLWVGAAALPLSFAYDTSNQELVRAVRGGWLWTAGAWEQSAPAALLRPCWAAAQRER